MSPPSGFGSVECVCFYNHVTLSGFENKYFRTNKNSIIAKSELLTRHTANRHLITPAIYGGEYYNTVSPALAK